MKKVAETVCNETSATALHGMLRGLGYNVSKGTLLDYLAMAREAYLLFEVKNAVAKFVEHEGESEALLQRQRTTQPIFDRQRASFARK